MKCEEMTRIVNEELKRISGGSKGSSQRWFREYFNAGRRHDLAKKNPEGFDAVVKRVTEHMQKSNPAFIPQIEGGLNV